MSGAGKGQPAKSPQPKQDDNRHGNDDAKALQEKIEEVAEELAKK